MASRESRISTRTVAIWLALFFILGLGLRIGWNVGPSFDDESDRYVYSGNDPYYHDRTVQHIVETGESIHFDPVINYPHGRMNPNPPIYDWTTAMVAGGLDVAGVEGDTDGLALNVMVALWGTLTIFPVYVIAASLFNRHAGLWAAFFMAASAPHIQRGVWGFADHDATTMFFITLAIAFLVKGLKSLDDREYVQDWRHGGAFVEGVRNSFAHNKTAMLWSALAGTALAATALTWKGYPYVLAVMAIGVGLQLLWDHVKNRDSTALWAFYLLPFVMVTLVPLPYYLVYSDFLDTTIWAGVYVLIGVVVVGLILVPTRDLPSIIVFPLLALAGVGGILAMLFLFPEVGRTVFTGLGYFQQSKLFSTIAEAQRSELGRVAASFAFFTFLLAFWGFGRSVQRAWKGDKGHMLMVSWAVVALFMAFAASRFIMNAAPVFAVLAAGVTVSLVSMVKWDEVRRRFRQQHGQNQALAGMRSLTMRATAGVLFVALLLVVPNLWIGVDAAIPREEDAGQKRLGAFGIDFDVKNNGWGEAFRHLAEKDQDRAFEDRPAFIGWWDYGHWATNLGKHPTVADPFQSHFGYAGRFLASETEQEAMAWMTILLVDGDFDKAPANTFSPDVEQVLADHNESLLGFRTTFGLDNRFELLSASIDLTGDAIYDLYDDVREATGTSVEYFGVDVRMYPFSANQPGIFYAPSYLANKNPDDFLPTFYTGQGLQLQVEQYAFDENGNSFRLAEPRITDSQGREYIIAGGNQAFRKGAPITAEGGIPVQPQLAPTQAFFDTMYARAFGHGQNDFVPGETLTHWRTVVQSEQRSVVLLQYYKGVRVSGTLQDDGGAPLSGLDVTFVDGHGASHDVATTGSDGAFTVLAPFSVEDDNGTGDLQLQVRSGDETLLAVDDYQFTEDQARFGHTVNDVKLVLERSSVNGTLYRDLNGNRSYDAGVDTAVAGATVTVGDLTTTSDDQGHYALEGIPPGTVDIVVQAEGYEELSQPVRLGSGDEVEADLALTPAESDATFVLSDQDGEPAQQVPFTVSPEDGDPQTGVTNSNGTASLSLAPGRYNFTVEYAVSEDGEPVEYAAERVVTVPFGGDSVTFEITVQRETG